ncbi:MAG: hypothetical protein ORN23_06640 [Chthoniobacterales bacterium]|jgi:hypothetical protein|nr:hypothetical protein [Chthoniobacterales bacterium]
MNIDNTQRKALLISTGITIVLILFAGGNGFCMQFRQANVEMWLYALSQSAGTSFICLLTYFGFAIADFFKGRKRLVGWLLCSVASVAIIFLAMYILPPPKSF